MLEPMLVFVPLPNFGFSPRKSGVVLLQSLCISSDEGMNSGGDWGWFDWPALPLPALPLPPEAGPDGSFCAAAPPLVEPVVPAPYGLYPLGTKKHPRHERASAAKPRTGTCDFMRARSPTFAPASMPRRGGLSNATVGGRPTGTLRDYHTPGKSRYFTRAA